MRSVCRGRGSFFPPHSDGEVAPSYGDGGFMAGRAEKLMCSALQLVERANHWIGVDQRGLVVVVQYGVEGGRAVGRNQAREMAGQLLGAPAPKFVHRNPVAMVEH